MLKVIKVSMPVDDEVVKSLSIGDQIEISGKIFCGRDAVLPQVVKLVEEEGEDALGVSLRGGAIFHTAVSPAGIGPTTSSKAEIQGTMPALSKFGIKLHIGKGALGLGGKTTALGTFLRIGNLRASGFRSVTMRLGCCFEPRRGRLTISADNQFAVE